MLTVQDVMTTAVLGLAPELSLRHAVEQLSAHHVTGAPVIAGGRVLGTISANDVLAFVASTPGVPTERGDEGGWPEEPIEPWAVDDEPAGSYFTELWEDAGADVSDRFHTIDSPEWDLLEEHTVAEAMSEAVVMLSPRAPLHEAAEFMNRTGVHRVLIGTPDRLVGIVTTMDVTRAFARAGSY